MRRMLDAMFGEDEYREKREELEEMRKKESENSRLSGSRSSHTFSISWHLSSQVNTGDLEHTCRRSTLTSVVHVAFLYKPRTHMRISHIRGLTCTNVYDFFKVTDFTASSSTKIKAPSLRTFLNKFIGAPFFVKTSTII